MPRALTRRDCHIALYFFVALSFTLATVAAPPDDFPTFQVPGHEQEMQRYGHCFGGITQARDQKQLCGTSGFLCAHSGLQLQTIHHWT